MADMTKRIAVSEFKAKYLALLDEVAATGMPLIVTKRGKPVVKLMPFGQVELPNLLGSVRCKRKEDLLEPVDEPWEADQ